jgi:hypothetical protein
LHIGAADRGSLAILLYIAARGLTDTAPILLQLFMALTIAYAVLLAAVAHTLVFGIVVWQKIDHPTAAKKQAPAPGAQA